MAPVSTGLAGILVATPTNKLTLRDKSAAAEGVELI